MISDSIQRFAYRIESLGALEPPVASMLCDAVAGDRIRQIVAAPRLRRLAEHTSRQRWLARLLPWRWTPAWTLVLTTTHLLVAERAHPDAAPVLYAIPLARLLSIEVAVVLLRGWLTCTWAEDGGVAQIKVEFNSVSDFLFWAIQRTVCTDLAAEEAQPGARRGAHSAAAELSPGAPAPNHIDPLERLPYKFRNLIPLRLLLPGEQIEAVVFQPAIWRRHVRMIQERLAPATVLLLTDLHLLLIAEGDVASGRTSHGLITRYFPRARLRNVTVTPEHAGTAVVTVETHGAAVIQQDTVRVEQTSVAAIQALVDRLFGQNAAGERSAATHDRPGAGSNETG